MLGGGAGSLAIYIFIDIYIFVKSETLLVLTRILPYMDGWLLIAVKRRLVVGLPNGRVGAGVVWRQVLGREEPGVEDGEIGGDDGEEEEEDANDLGDVKGFVSFQEVGENSEDDDGR